MKKLFLLVLVLFAITTTLVKSQTPTECTSPACSGPESNWHYPGSPYGLLPIAADTNGCEMLVYYKWRICEGPPIRREVEIIKIEFINGSNCSNTPNSAIMNQAVKALLASSRGIFGEDVGTFDVTVRIPGCISRTALNGTIYLSNIGCSPNCCEKTYLMSFADGVMICIGQITQTTVNCGSITGNNCETNCDDIDMPLNTPLYAKHYNNLWLCSPNGTIESCNTIIDEGIKTATYKDNEKRILINYLYRKCASHQFEIKVLGIQIIRFDGNWTEYEWIRFSYTVVFRDLRIHTTPPEDGRQYRIGAYVNSCWTSTFSYDYRVNPPTQHRVFVYPCTDIYACCYRYITVQRQNTGKYIITFAEPAILANNYQCSYSCNDHCIVVEEFDINTGDLPKISFDVKGYHTDEYKIFPNPSENVINIKVVSDYIGKIVVSIIDNKGNEVLNKIIVKYSIEFEQIIDITKFTNGIYHYTIVYGSNNKTGSFVIYK